MFYLKDGKRKLAIESDNVFTRCPRCGQEIPVDLGEILSDNGGDLYGTSVYCEACAKRIEKLMKKQEGTI